MSDWEDVEDNSEWEDVSTPEEAPLNMLETGLSTVGKVISPIAERIDRYTGAPVRSAVSELQNARGDILGAIPKAASAFKNQFGEDTTSAPSATDLAVRAGLSPEKMGEIPVPGTRWNIPVSPAGVGGVVLGAATDPLTYAAPAAKYIGKGIKPGTDMVRDYLKAKAGRFAENATGATRLQAEKFAPGAGKELLDRGIVKPFSGPEGIAKRAAKLQDVADKNIGNILAELDAKGVRATSDDVLSAIQKRIDKLKLDPSASAQTKALESIKESVADSLRASGAKSGSNELLGYVETPPSDVLLSTVEDWKRGFNKNRKINWANPDMASANKEAYGALRETTENVATKAAPELAESFIENKQTHGLLAPIIEASEKRATQLNQHPILGLNDVAAYGAGALSAPEKQIGGLLGLVGRRVVGPRSASTAAAGLNTASNIVGSVPGSIGPLAATTSVAQRVVSPQYPSEQEIAAKVQGTPYAKAFDSAKKRNGADSVSTTYFLLGQSDPEFRKLFKNE